MVKTMIIEPKNWGEFQHYKDRSPTWIKLHKRLLDDYQYSCLPISSKALAPYLWLLASEYDDGVIDATEEEICFRLRLNPSDFKKALDPLETSMFFAVYQDASSALSDEERKASLEKRREEKEKREKAFDKFWKAYPKKQSIQTARTSFKQIKPDLYETIFKAIETQKNTHDWIKDEGKYVPMPSTWLNQERWNDVPTVPQRKRLPELT